MFRQYAAWEQFNLAKRDGFKPARPFKAKAKAAEQIQDAKLGHSLSSTPQNMQTQPSAEGHWQFLHGRIVGAN
jgi:hypothetical protein